MVDANVEQKVITANEVTWTYMRSGEGPPLVWLHGLWGDPSWDAHHRSLAENYTVYAPALPGYYGTVFPEWMSDIEDVAAAFIDLLDALKLDTPALVGHSMGGWAAAEVAVFRPKRVRGLVLIDPLGIALDWTKVPSIFYNDPAKYPGIFFADPSLEPVRRYVPPVQEWKNEVFYRNREGSIRLGYDPYLHSRRLPHRLHFVKAPTLIVWGEQDGLLGPEHAKAWQAHIPQAQISIVKNAGHFPHVERPESCLPGVMEFLRRIYAKEVTV